MQVHTGGKDKRERMASFYQIKAECKKTREPGTKIIQDRKPK